MARSPRTTSIASRCDASTRIAQHQHSVFPAGTLARRHGPRPPYIGASRDRVPDHRQAPKQMPRGSCLGFARSRIPAGAVLLKCLRAIRRDQPFVFFSAGGLDDSRITRCCSKHSSAVRAVRPPRCGLPVMDRGETPLRLQSGKSQAKYRPAVGPAADVARLMSLSGRAAPTEEVSR